MPATAAGVGNKMQSETADFAPVPPSGGLDETYDAALLLLLGIRENITSSTKPKAYNVSKDRPTVTGNM